MWGIITENWLSLILTAVISYLLGSLNFAIIITRIFSKEDIRTYGSGNAGATNVLRSQGKLPAVLTTLGDLTKSFLAVMIGDWLLSGLGRTGSSEELVGCYLAGVCCILGHLYPLYFGFRGGKGVMTALGMMLLLDWRVALLCLGVFILVVLFSRMVSAGSVAAAVMLPVLTFLFRMYVDKTKISTMWFCTGMTVLIGGILVIKHLPNIRRILQGTENKIGKKKEETS